MRHVNVIQNEWRKKYCDSFILIFRHVLSCLSHLLMLDALDILSVICDKPQLLKALSVCVRPSVFASVRQCFLCDRSNPGV